MEGANGNRPSRPILFISFVIPIWVLCVALGYEWHVLSSLADNIIADFNNYKAEIKGIVLRYEDQFTAAQIDSTKNNQPTIEIATATTGILNKISNEMIHSLLIVAIAGHVWAIIQAISTWNLYKGDKNKKSKGWVDAISSVSSAVSGAVTVAITILGAVSFLSPEIVGGYILAGLQALLICVILGILVTSFRGSVDMKFGTGADEGKVTISRETGPMWEGLTSMQFVTLILGIFLLIRQILFF